MGISHDGDEYQVTVKKGPRMSVDGSGYRVSMVPNLDSGTSAKLFYIRRTTLTSAAVAMSLPLVYPKSSSDSG